MNVILVCGFPDLGDNPKCNDECKLVKPTDELACSSE